MYGLSKDTDLRFLVGKELLQVRVGKHHIEMLFHGDVAIDVEGRISLDQKTSLSGISAGMALLDLIGSQLQLVEIAGRGDLVITFHSGHRLSIHDSNQEYESYQLRGPGTLIVV